MNKFIQLYNKDQNSECVCVFVIRREITNADFFHRYDRLEACFGCPKYPINNSFCLFTRSKN